MAPAPFAFHEQNKLGILQESEACQRVQVEADRNWLRRKISAWSGQPRKLPRDLPWDACGRRRTLPPPPLFTMKGMLSRLSRKIAGKREEQTAAPWHPRGRLARRRWVRSTSFRSTTIRRRARRSTPASHARQLPERAARLVRAVGWCLRNSLHDDALVNDLWYGSSTAQEAGLDRWPSSSPHRNSLQYSTHLYSSDQAPLQNPFSRARWRPNDRRRTQQPRAEGAVHLLVPYVLLIFPNQNAASAWSG